MRGEICVRRARGQGGKYIGEKSERVRRTETKEMRNGNGNKCTWKVT